MNSGALDRLVTIVTPSDLVLDNWGEPDPKASPPSRVEAWSAIKTAPGTERFQSGENLALAPLRFFFRWRADLVRPQSVIEYDGKVFDVKSVQEVARRQLLEVGAVARVT